MEYQETMNFWKQQPHVLKFFTEEEAVKGKPKPSTFVDKFLQVSFAITFKLGTITNSIFRTLYKHLKIIRNSIVIQVKYLLLPKPFLIRHQMGQLSVRNAEAPC